MGASTQSRNENKQYAVLVVYANKTDKILDITTSSNIKCYEWSLKKRLTETKADYTPTNKALKFVKTKFDDVSNVRVVKLNEFYGNFGDAKNHLEVVSKKVKLPSTFNIDTFKDNELTELKQLVEPEKIEKVDDVVVETDVLNSVIEDADKTDTEPPKVLVKPFYCELTDRYFTTKSSLAKHIKKSKEYQKALSLTTN
tara:strand:+ start:376 stop:969 length:594 start_codon:yes stop_codon:yes gene_type:complete